MTEWRLQDPASGVIGPVQLATVRDLAASGIIKRDVLVAKDNGPFLPIASFVELAQVQALLREAPAPDYSGDFAVTSFYAMLTRLFRGRATGLFVARDGTRRKDVFLVDGVPVFVASTTVKERLGELLVTKKRLSAAELKTALASSHEQKQSFGETLVRLGFLTEAEVVAELREQQLGRLVDLCTWDRGRYGFFEGTRYQGRHIDLALDTPELVLRAARVMPEKTALLRLERHLHEVVSETPNGLSHVCVRAFTPEEQAARKRIDGQRTVVSLLTEPGLRRVTLVVLYLLWETGALEFRRAAM